MRPIGLTVSTASVPSFMQSVQVAFSAVTEWLSRAPEAVTVSAYTTGKDTPFVVTHNLGVVPKNVFGCVEGAGRVIAMAEDRAMWNETTVTIRADTDTPMKIWVTVIA